MTTTRVTGLRHVDRYRFLASYTMSKSPALLRARAWPPETHPGQQQTKARRFAFGVVNELADRTVFEIPLAGPKSARRAAVLLPVAVNGTLRVVSVLQNSSSSRSRMASGFAPGVATEPHSRSAALARLAGSLIVWAGSDLFGWLASVAFCVAGLSFVAGIVRIRDHRIAEFAGPEAIKNIGKIHWAMWGLATIFASIILAQAVGEYSVGALSITHMLLALCYVALEYAWILVIVAWRHSLDAFRELAWPRGTSSLLTRSLIFAACVCSSVWLTGVSIKFFEGTIAIDFPYAMATAETRAGKPMDTLLKEEGKNSSLYMALKFVATPKRCTGRNPEDLYISIDATRQFVMPYTTTRSLDGHFVSNTNELDGSRIVNCTG